MHCVTEAAIFVLVAGECSPIVLDTPGRTEAEVEHWTYPLYDDGLPPV